MNFIRVFSDIVSTIELKGVDLDKLVNECYKIKEDNNTVRKSNVGGWQSPSNLVQFVQDKKNSELYLLLDTIQNVLNQFTEENKIKKLLLDTAWININSTGDYNSEHIHPQSLFSGVFYIQVPEDSESKFIFRRDSLVTSFSYPSLFTDNTSKEFFQAMCESYSIIPEASKMLLFPSHMSHTVYPNKSAKDRISLSFNTTVEL